MSSVTHILFDFDGTLVDSLEVVVSIVLRHASASERRYFEENRNRLKDIGVRQAMQESGTSSVRLVYLLGCVLYELKTKSHSLQLFDGIEQVVRALASEYTLGIVSTNSARKITQTLKAHDLGSAFSFISSHSSIFGKAERIQKAARENNFSLNQAVYVGDEDRDVEATKTLGLPMIAVAWGYNSEQRLREAGADLLALQSKDILTLVGALNQES